MQELRVPEPADFHSHLRQGQLMRLVVPHVRAGGFTLAYVMPNLSPPIATTEQAIAYHAELQALEPGVDFLMTLFLSPSLTVDEIRRAKASGIVHGVKSYPRGVTTGSDAGVESYERYFDVFAEMERLNMVLNLHGELPSSARDDIHVFNAERRFLGMLVDLHRRFPRLRIVLEHATTAEAVKALGDTVGCTITAHHLALTLDDVVGRPLHFCKPVAKAPSDRAALRSVIASGHPRFFLGSDSAPHPIHSKLPPRTEEAATCAACAAGVYTSATLLPLLADLFEDETLGVPIPIDRLSEFASGYGRAFYGRPGNGASARLVRRPTAVPSSYGKDDIVVIPFRAGQTLSWTLEHV